MSADLGGHLRVHHHHVAVLAADADGAVAASLLVQAVASLLVDAWLVVQGVVQL